MLINFELSAGGASALTQQLGIGIWVVQHEALMGDGAADVLTDFQQDFYYWTTLFITPADGSLRTRQYGLIDIKTSWSIRGGYGLLFKSQNPIQDVNLNLAVSMRNLWVPAP